MFDDSRVQRCWLHRNEAFRGYIASKRRYFYGLRLHVIVTAEGHPVEVPLAPAAEADITAFKCLWLDLPEYATLYADKIYAGYIYEDALNEGATLTFIALRKRNSKLPHPVRLSHICQHARKRNESAFSQNCGFLSQAHPRHHPARVR